jgi:hypothetical protein
MRQTRNRNTTILGVCVAVTGLAGIAALLAAASPAAEKTPSRLCVVWSSGDPGVAESVCFMYTKAAKQAGWFDEVHLVVWGPSAKLLAANEQLQARVKAMQKAGVVTEACVACARMYGVADTLRELDLDVKGMGRPLSDRLQGDWQVITF